MAGQQTLQLSIRGLHTFNSELSGVPSGALLIGKNANINRVNIFEPRRGFNFYADQLTGSERAYTLFDYGGVLWTHTSTTLYVNLAGWVARGTVSAPTGYRLRNASLNRNLYVTTNNGIYKTDSTSTSVGLAGVQAAISFTAATTGSSGFLADTYFVAYRMVFGRKDANSNVILGGASQRVQVRNTAGGSATRNVAITAQIPAGIVEGDFVQFYRTESSAAEPAEEYKQCYERILTSADILAGSYSFTDNVIDDLLGGYLYVSDSQGGIINQHIALPYVRDLCAYKGYLIGANVRYRHFFNLTLTSVGTTGANTLQTGDTVTFTRGATTKTYTANSGTPSAGQFKLYTTGTTSENIRDTSLALIAAINSDATGYLYATYLSGYNDLPGKILLEARDLTDAVFSVTSSRGGAWSPSLPSSGTTSVNQSTADDYPNGIAYSEQYEPEHWTDFNFDEVGSRDQEIMRIVPLQDAVVIFTKGGVYSLRGEVKEDFTIKQIDNTAILVAPEALCVLNNTIYAYLTTGFAAITDQTVTIKSLPIKDQLLDIQGAVSQTNLKELSHAVGYPTEGKAIFVLPSTEASTYADKTFVFDIYNESFLVWDTTALCGTVFNDKLYFGSPTSTKILEERKNLDYTDLADYGAQRTILSFTGFTVTLNDASLIQSGDILQQGSLYAYVVSADATSGVVTVDVSGLDWSAGSVDWLKALEIEIAWNPEFSGNPAGYKQWSECSFLFKRGFIGDATAYFYTDTFTGQSEVAIDQAAGSGNFGDFAFGSVTFGGDPNKAPLRVGIPRNAAKGDLLFVGLRHRVAWSDFQLNGLSLVFRPISTRSTR